MRTLPGPSWIGRFQLLSEDQVIVAVVALPVSSTSASGAVLLAPVASFQLLLATTPATSVPPMAVPAPTKSMLSVLAVELTPAVTVSVTVVVCESEPLVPVMVSVVGPPVGVVAPAVMVRVELMPGVTEAGLKPNDAPEGRPLTPSVTDPVKPLSAPTLTVYGTLLPGRTDALAGEAEIVKSGAGEPRGTIWMPFTGARFVPSEAVLGMAERVKPLTFGMVNTT